MNAMILAIAGILIMAINYFPFTLRQLFVFLGVFGIAQSIFLFLHLNSPRSLIPVFGEVAQYEKEKMGAEWLKQQKVAIAFTFFFSVFLFYMAFATPLPEEYMQFSFKEIAGFIGFMIVVLNLSLFFRMRKVDRSVSPADFKGYTLRTNILAVLAGIGLGVLMVIFIIISVVKEAI
ncbi:hypothetical protein [Bacillus sp. AK031]